MIAYAGSKTRKTPIGGGWRLTAPALLLVLVCLSACARDLAEVESDRGALLESRKFGFRVANLGATGNTGGSGLRRIDLEGAVLAYRDADGSVYSLGARCRPTQASVGALARHLTIGTPREALLAAGPVEHRGDQGWSQTFDTHEGATRLRIKAVTLSGGACVFDWMLVAIGPERFARAEPVFDDWWQSFERERGADETANGGDSS